MGIHAQGAMDLWSPRGGVLLVEKRAARICLVGDYDPKVTAHQAIPKALALAAEGNAVEPVWLGTELALDADLDPYSGFWCVPASPYRSMEGALRVIRFAREGESLSWELAPDVSTPLWSLRGTCCA